VHYFVRCEKDRDDDSFSKMRTGDNVVSTGIDFRRCSSIERESTAGANTCDFYENCKRICVLRTMRGGKTGSSLILVFSLQKLKLVMMTFSYSSKFKLLRQTICSPSVYPPSSRFPEDCSGNLENRRPHSKPT
jgi:hypothetical protein